MADGMFDGVLPTIPGRTVYGEIWVDVEWSDGTRCGVSFPIVSGMIFGPAEEPTPGVYYVDPALECIPFGINDGRAVACDYSGYGESETTDIVRWRVRDDSVALLRTYGIVD